MAAALAAFDAGVPCPAIISAARMPVLRHLPSGIAPLDSLLGGGFAKGMLTEVCVIEGCAKLSCIPTSDGWLATRVF
jgi:RecA/RadA recombinase